MPAPQLHLTFGDLVQHNALCPPALRKACAAEPIYARFGSIFHDLPYYYAPMVFEAVREDIGGRAAVKVLRPELAQNPEIATRFFNEARAANLVEHTGIVRVFDYGSLPSGVVYLAMEYVAGQSLGAWIHAHRPSWRALLDAYLAAGEGLAAAHAAGLVHRDLKPDNIMIGADGRVRVMDFGLARAAGPQEAAPVVRPTARPIAAESSVLATPVTHAGLIIGTPTYMAPEQWTGLPLDARVDQFAFT